MKLNFKLVRKFLILSILVTGVFFAASSNLFVQPVSAAPCCEGCYGDGDQTAADNACGVSCYWYWGSSPQFATCYSECQAAYQNCYSHCVYCSSPGGPGGECSTSMDCPINQFCDASNHCSNY